LWLKDEVCTPMDHILDWSSGLVIVNPEQSGA
jgi:RNA polymerase subunit RPABC4/transcription elongation factor Spt4